ncbi:PREDICTED: uncharacterized protein LOC106806008 [Priapulus caudatus]|uniref:Uncharacterized protein LOC106806008 n=1 Tax=Priapulus caudatus TaxID=37621 RepID=A0ABM1DTP8_PRICU|nr:PREDICTED: uncharacterized protein LOC106806008 [Priapulus caudatus]
MQSSKLDDFMSPTHDTSIDDILRTTADLTSSIPEDATTVSDGSQQASSFWSTLLRCPLDSWGGRCGENDLVNFPLPPQYGDFATVVQNGDENNQSYFSYFSHNNGSTSTSRSGAEGLSTWTAEYNPFGTIDLKFNSQPAADPAGNNNGVGQPRETPVSSPSPPPAAAPKPKYSDVVGKRRGKAMLVSDGYGGGGGSSAPVVEPRRRAPPRAQKCRQSAMHHRDTKDTSPLVKAESKPESLDGDNTIKVATKSPRLSTKVPADGATRRPGLPRTPSSDMEENPLPKSSGKHDGAAQDAKPPSGKVSEKQAAKSGKPEEKPFFDPRRIFTCNRKEVRKSANNLRNDSVLNNDKGFGSLDCNAKLDAATYINNDLSAEQTCAEGGKPDNVPTFRRRAKAEAKVVNQTQVAPSRKQLGKKSRQCQTASHRGVEFGQAVLLGLQKMLLWLITLLGNVILLSVHLALVLLMKVFDYCYTSSVRAWYTGLQYVKKKFHGQKEANKIWQKGLEQNITLPTTGEEAMRRLLTVRGRDTYTILGVTAAATQEEITKYYRRQAVLVHPDKNRLPGAEEAFKILAHAFDIVGEPDSRRKYDEKIMHSTQVESAMTELSDLLSKMRDKIKEAATIMRCDRCGGRHRRHPQDRPVYAARFCAQCNIRHAAKEGDIWAETAMFGLRWHYYAMISGHVYQVTEWATCQRRRFQYLQANSHNVTTKVMFVGKRQPHSPDLPSEEGLEEFLEHLYHKAQKGDDNNMGAAASGGQDQPTGKRKRRRKKR